MLGHLLNDLVMNGRDIRTGQSAIAAGPPIVRRSRQRVFSGCPGTGEIAAQLREL